MTALDMCVKNAKSSADPGDQQGMENCSKCGHRHGRMAEKCDGEINPVIVCLKCDYCSLDGDSVEDSEDCRCSKAVQCRLCVVSCESSDIGCKEHDGVMECDKSTGQLFVTPVVKYKDCGELSVTPVVKCRDCGNPVENLQDKVNSLDGEQKDVRCLECEETALNSTGSTWSTKCEDCGNSNKKWFHKIVSDNDVQLICLACLKTWKPDSTIGLQELPELRMTGKKRVFSKQKRTHRRVKDLRQLHCGDHIAWDRAYIVWHHAIVTAVDVAASQLTVIHNSGGIKDMPNGRLASVRVETFNVDCKFEFLYVFEYDESECFTPEEVIERATQRLDDSYDPFTNNCEHFARWCKTGQKYSLQRKFFDDRLKMGASGFAKVIEELLMTAVRFFGKSESMQDILGVGSQNAAAIIEARLGCFTAPNTIVHGLQIGTFFMGLILAILAEIIFFSCKLYEAKKDADAKYMPVDVFQRGVFQLLTEGLVGLGGGLGAAFGMSLVPYAGPFLSPIGYVLGNWIGRLIGALIGRLLVELFYRYKLLH